MTKQEQKPDCSVAQMTAHDKCMAAMAIIQLHTGASDSCLNMQAVFGGYYAPDCALELAAKLLVEVLEPLEMAEASK